MTVLSKEIAAYERMRAELEASHGGRWAVFHQEDFVGVFSEFEDAATEAIERFDLGPYLIRQIGVEVIPVSSTAVFRPLHA